MVDFRVDDGFPHHPKALGLSLEAVGAWTLIGCWCARYLSDGYIPDDALRTITTRTRVIQDLANRNLITKMGDGWQMVDWGQYQRTRAQVEAQRKRGRERVARWRAEHRQADDQ